MPHKAKGFTQDDRKKQKATKLSNLINMRMGINQLKKNDLLRDLSFSGHILKIYDLN